MKIQSLNYFFAVYFVLLILTIAHCQEIKDNESTKTTTETSPLQSSLDRIIKKVESIKARINKTLSETADNMIGNTRHDMLVKKGYKLSQVIGYHKLYTNKLNWKDAYDFCRRENAHLAVIDSAHEVSILRDLVKNGLPKNLDKLNVAYVGYKSCNFDHFLESIFFDPIAEASYIKRHYSEEVGEGPNCALIDEAGMLRVSVCGSAYAFICEMELY